MRFSSIRLFACAVDFISFGWVGATPTTTTTTTPTTTTTTTTTTTKTTTTTTTTPKNGPEHQTKLFLHAWLRRASQAVTTAAFIHGFGCMKLNHSYMHGCAEQAKRLPPRLSYMGSDACAGAHILPNKPSLLTLAWTCRCAQTNGGVQTHKVWKRYAVYCRQHKQMEESKLIRFGCTHAHHTNVYIRVYVLK